MSKAIPFALAAAASIVVAGCDRDGGRDDQRGKADTAKIAEAIKGQEASWQKDFSSRNVEALAAHYATDAAIAGPGDALATDQTARRAMLQAMVGDPNLKLTFAADRVQVAKSGDLAYSRGHYSMTMTDRATHKPANSNGSYLTVWQKQSDNSWKAVEDFITPGPAPAAAAPTGN